MTRILPASLALLAVSALAFASGSALTRAAIVGATDLPTMPRAKDMVTIRGGGPYVVPLGYRLVLTDVHMRGVPSTSGPFEFKLFPDSLSSPDPDMTVFLHPGETIRLPSNYSVPSGSSVVLGGNPSGVIQASGDMLLTGYLELDH